MMAHERITIAQLRAALLPSTVIHPLLPIAAYRFPV
jgi:hypothetical protein